MSNWRKTRSSAKIADPVTPTPVTPRAVATAAATPLSVLSLKSVWLHDWWLAPALDKGLAIGGFESRGRQGVRVFQSAAIAKRHSATILETTDGIRITISGLINRTRTHQNGFPLEVCGHFLIGFPYYWRKYATRNYNGESTDRDIPKQFSGVFGLNLSGSNTSSFLPGSLSDQPAARIHDAILFSQSRGGSGSFNLIKTIMNDLLENSSDSSSEHHSNNENKCRSNTATHISREKIKVTKNCRDPISREKIKVTKSCRGHGGGVSDRRSTRLDVQIDGQLKNASNAVFSSVGVTTRSMSRVKNLQTKQENNLSMNRKKR